MPTIIDGYNFIGRASGLTLGEPGVEERLISIIARLQRKKRGRYVIVFDGSNNEDNEFPSYKHGSVLVYFSPPGVDADTLIKTMIRDSQNKKELKIVTSDNEIIDYAVSHGAKTVKSELFAKTIESALQKKIEKFERPLSSKEVDEWMKIFSKKVI
jgi:predicted RNA-binding protein with PIN domain